MADDTTNALRALLCDLRDWRQMRLYGDAFTPRIESAIAALATAQPEAKPEGVDDEARWQVFAQAFGLNLEPPTEKARTLTSAHYRYQHAQDAWEAWCKAREATRQAQGGGEESNG